METLIEALAQFIEDNTSLEVGSTLMIGEMIRGTDGVFIVEGVSDPPDVYQTSLEYHSIDFWSQNKAWKNAWSDLNEIYELLHTQSNIQIGDWYVWLTKAISQLADLDRNVEGQKQYKFTVEVTCAYRVLES